MDTINSLSVYTDLFYQLYDDIAQCYLDVVNIRIDKSKIKSRVQHEGISFLTKTLPALGKKIDKSLSGHGPLVLDHLKRSKTGAPLFLWWLLGRVFTTDGYVRSDADITALKHIRQLVYFLYKLALPYSNEQQKNVITRFIQNDRDLQKDFPIEVGPVLGTARILITRVLGDLCHRDILPRHGPGAVSTGEDVGEKSNFARIYRSLDSEYPFTGYFVSGDSQTVDQLDWIQGLEVHETGTAKVVLVPKDSRGPRLISCEPLEIQWIQQGLRARLYEHVARCPLTRGHVNFRNQNVNRRLALLGSRTGKCVTLDMKDASDCVSLKLVKDLFSGTGFLAGLLAARSAKTRLPDGSILDLEKFAPMGSAVCFPVEALVFWSLIVSMLSLHGRSLRHCLRTVYVYGDDIICDAEDYGIVMQWLPKFGLKLNEDKCCVGGFFRESCGCDAFKGIDVTPLRLKSTWYHRRKLESTEILSYVELSNSLYARGYVQTAECVKQLVETRYGNLPLVEMDSNIQIAFKRDEVVTPRCNRGRVRYRFNRSLQVIEYRTWCVRPLLKKYKEDGWRRLTRVLTCGSSTLPPGFYAQPRRSCLQRGWGRD